MLEADKENYLSYQDLKQSLNEKNNKLRDLIEELKMSKKSKEDLENSFFTILTCATNKVNETVEKIKILFSGNIECILSEPQNVEIDYAHPSSKCDFPGCDGKKSLRMNAKGKAFHTHSK
jgi:hypothetical protein